ncbi:MAG: HAD family hydrolase [Candidatus Eremiobacteraeota bacterium]|nr:HAD family hydrolase [Candidatus Eremiobacteraeota bacterium]MBC5802274.1 HAD family hydrolase [Candidatus Eremiobacteraeota bacterium]MBC5822161.1 HAD family hydrolase [Candidatus Eremiobacteraeota bacterium]
MLCLVASSTPLRAVLLDVDGTLIDSNDAQARSWLDAFEEAHLDVDPGAVRRLIGKGGDRLLREVADLDIDAEPGKTISQRHKAIFAERYLPGLSATRGARDLLVWLRSQGAQLVVATSAGEEEMRALLQTAGVDDLIDVFTSSDDADETKPAPDILGAALRKSKRSAAESVMIGDTPYDCEAAGRIGLPAIGLRCGGWSSEELPCESVFDHPADLLANYRASPLRRLSGVSA